MVIKAAIVFLLLSPVHATKAVIKRAVVAHYYSVGDWRSAAVSVEGIDGSSKEKAARDSSDRDASGHGPENVSVPLRDGDVVHAERTDESTREVFPKNTERLPAGWTETF